MTTLPRRLRTLRPAGLAAAVLLGVTACGGGIGEDAPTDASVADFCDVVLDSDRSAGEVAGDLADVGTPEGIGADERNGFEVYVDALEDKDDEDYTAAQGDLEVPEDDVADGNAFILYLTDTCEQYLSELEPTDAPTDAPS